jgi:hypothetical protein
MKRPVNAQEAEVIRWLLDHASVRDSADYRLKPIEQLRVVGGCSCGCTSLDFIPKEQKGKAEIVADAVAVYLDGAQAGLILWGRDGNIESLEVYDYHPESSHRFPDISDLHTFEELGLRNAQ